MNKMIFLSKTGGSQHAIKLIAEKNRSNPKFINKSTACVLYSVGYKLTLSSNVRRLPYLEQICIKRANCVNMPNTLISHLHPNHL